MTYRRLETGRTGERLACEHLLEHGYQLIERNFRTREGEIDLVVTDGHTLVFCEVKTLASHGPNGPAFAPLESIRPAKRAQVRRMARIWLAQKPNGSYRQVRFDAIGVMLDDAGRAVELNHIESAF